MEGTRTYGAENPSKPKRNLKSDGRKSDQSGHLGKRMLLMIAYPVAVAE